MISKFKEIYTNITDFDFTKENLSSRLREKVELRDFFVMLLLEHNVKRIDIINAMNKNHPFIVNVRQRHNDKYKLYSQYRQDYDDVRRIFNNQLKQNVSGSPKMTFGLTPKNIEVIKKYTSRWEGAEYDRDTWIRVGEEIGCEPLTACLWWFRKDCH